MNKNFVAFMLVSAAIMASWVYLQTMLPPPPPAKKDTPAQAKDKKDDAKKGDAKTEVAKDKGKAPEPVIEAPADKEAPPANVETFRLGDETSFLRAVVTNLGAGVRSLTLTRFEAADYLGNPVRGKELELIQDDPYMPSFRMYHFQDPSAESPPVLGLGEAVWEVEAGVRKDAKGWKITFWTPVPGQPRLKILKTYTLQPGDYHLGLTLEIENAGEAGEAAFRYQLTGAHGLPIEGEWYTSPAYMRSAVVGIVDARDNLTRTMEDSMRVSRKLGGDRVPAGNNAIQYAGVMNQYFASAIVVSHQQAGSDWRKARVLDWARPTHASTEVKAKLLRIDDDTVAFSDAEGKIRNGRLLPRARAHLETLGLVKGQTCVVNFYQPPRAEAVITWFRNAETPQAFFDDLTVRVHSDVLKIPAGGKVAHEYLLYHGPVKTKLLGQFMGDARVAPALVDLYTYQVHLRTLTDYHSDTTIGWFFSVIGWTSLLIFCTNLMHGLLYWLQFLVFGNYGLAILLMTVVVRGALYPISRKTALMAQRMQEVAPELKKVQEKYKDDPQQKAQATFELYRKHKINPASGCLPFLLQMPIFLGLYYALQESVQFRLAEFLWIDNLAAPDMLLWWGEWTIYPFAFLTNPEYVGQIYYLGPYFNLLPLFAVALMIVQQKMLTPPPQNEEQEFQQKAMRVMMGVMGVFFFKVAAGLSLYFIASSLWGVAERKLLPKKKPAAEAALAAGPTGAVKPTPTARDRRRDRERVRDNPEESTALDRLKEWWHKLLESAEKK